MEDFSILIKKWYRQNGRDLPWRSQNDPYKIWLSEIILQQTRVDQGLAYYLKFIERYPTVKNLAMATEDEILSDWQGLGYYSRARNLHSTAKYVYGELNSVFPADYDSVLSLKGVGEYTAAAICSFSYNLPYAVLDGNVFRLLSRYLNLTIPIDSTVGKKVFKEAAKALLDAADPATHNQAIMEMGALVCTPKKPNCKNCPLSVQCLAFSENNQEGLPIKEKKTKVRIRHFHYYVNRDLTAILLKKRGPKDIWQGLYDFPLIEREDEKHPTKDDLNALGISGLVAQSTFKHLLSHQHIYATFWLSDFNDLDTNENFIQIGWEELGNYPMPQLLIRYLQSRKDFVSD